MPKPMELVAPEIHYEIEQFLFEEARMLDSERYPEWLELLTDDIHYWAPAIHSRYRRDPNGSYGSDQMALFDDSLEDLRQRVDRVLSGQAWAEDPPTRCARIVSNVSAKHGSVGDEYVVYSNLLYHRARNQKDESVVYARRQDVLRNVDGDLRLARRKVLINHSVLMMQNLSSFL